ncbi:hypothetical protein MRB53_039311 [Persea americana]|nr:hypothetical protein MRB53_039311 [Persea americana]
MPQWTRPFLPSSTASIKPSATVPSIPTPPSFHPAPILTKYSHPPAELLKAAQPSLAAVSSAASIKKVPPKALSRKRARGSRPEDAPRSGLDVSALLSSRATAQAGKIDPSNAIPEFKQLVLAADDVAAVRSSVTQMGGIVENWVKSSTGDGNYARAIEAMRVMREECVEMEEPGDVQRVGAESQGQGAQRRAWRRSEGVLVRGQGEQNGLDREGTQRGV